MQSNVLPSEQHCRRQYFQRRLLTFDSLERPRRVTVIRSIVNSRTTHKPIALPHNTRHPHTHVGSMATSLEEPRRQDTGTRSSTMPSIRYRVFPRKTRAMTRCLYRNAVTKTKDQSTSSRSLLLRICRDAGSGLKAHRRIHFEVIWLDRRWTSS